MESVTIDGCPIPLGGKIDSSFHPYFVRPRMACSTRGVDRVCLEPRRGRQAVCLLAVAVSACGASRVLRRLSSSSLSVAPYHGCFSAAGRELGVTLIQLSVDNSRGLLEATPPKQTRSRQTRTRQTASRQTGSRQAGSRQMRSRSRGQQTERGSEKLTR